MRKHYTMSIVKDAGPSQDHYEYLIVQCRSPGPVAESIDFGYYKC